MSKRSQDKSFHLAVKLRSKVFLSAPRNVGPHTDIKALCLLKVSGFPSACSRCCILNKSQAHTIYKQVQEDKVKDHPLLSSHRSCWQTANSVWAPRRCHNVPRKKKKRNFVFFAASQRQDNARRHHGCCWRRLSCFKAWRWRELNCDEWKIHWIFVFYYSHTSPLALCQLRASFHVAHYFLFSVKWSGHKSSFPCNQLNQTQRRRWSWKPPLSS